MMHVKLAPHGPVVCLTLNERTSFSIWHQRESATLTSSSQIATYDPDAAACPNSPSRVATGRGFAGQRLPYGRSTAYIAARQRRIINLHADLPPWKRYFQAQIVPKLTRALALYAAPIGHNRSAQPFRFYQSSPGANRFRRYADQCAAGRR